MKKYIETRPMFFVSVINIIVYATAFILRDIAADDYMHVFDKARFAGSLVILCSGLFVGIAAFSTKREYGKLIYAGYIAIAVVFVFKMVYWQTDPLFIGTLIIMLCVFSIWTAIGMRGDNGAVKTILSLIGGAIAMYVGMYLVTFYVHF